MAAFAPASPAAATAPPLRGAATHPLWPETSVADFDRELDLLVAAGANTVRIDFGWATLEPEGDDRFAEWYVRKADVFFAHARARGLRAIVTFWTTPCWASSAPAEIKQGCAGAWWDRGVNIYPPSDPAEFAEAAEWVARRWGDDMAAIEIWNEPNFRGWFESSAPAADYAAILRPAYTRIKQVKPRLPVLAPAMLVSDVPFLEELYRHGIHGYFDGLSMRPFNQGRDPFDPTVPPLGPPHVYVTAVPWVYSTMVAHGDGAKRIWFTELGFSSCAPGPSVWCITPELQARYIANAFLVIRDRWDYVESVSIYNLRNKGTDPLDRESQMGLVHRDFTPKPAYWAFRDVLAEMAARPFPPGAPASPATPAAATPRRRDRKPPVLARLAVSVRAGGRALSVAYRLSEPARVLLRLERAARGGCGERCARPVAVRRRAVRPGRRGRNRTRLTLRGLRPGRYRLSASARDRAGNRSAVRRVAFELEGRR